MEKTIEMYGGKIYGVTVSDYGIKKDIWIIGL